MQIMCLNGWGGKLHSDLIAYIAETQPEVLCLQEVVHTPESAKDWLTYRDGDHILKQRANFYSDVERALSKHTGFFCPAARGVLWDEERSVPSFWGLATFVRRDLTVVGAVQGFVHKDYTPDGYGAHPRARSAHGVRLHDPKTDRRVSITHMHGLRDLRGKMDTPERRVQAKRLLAMSDCIAAGPDEMRVICGDFNVEPQSETLSILRSAGFTELVSAYGYDTTRTSHYEKPAPFADYMLVNQPEAVTSFEVVAAPEVSDHCPLVLTL